MKGIGFLFEKPWLPQPQGSPSAPETHLEAPAVKIALGFLLVVISVFFILFFVTFIERSQYEDFRALAGEPWQPFTDSWRLWVNTAVLLVASLAMHLAVRSVRGEQATRLLGALSVGACAALLFLVLQASVWQFLARLGYGLGENSANSYYFILTGLHALHLAGGLVALGRVFIGFFRGRPIAELKTTIESCAIYWHYLFLLWLVLFFLLTRTPEAYATIAALCGLG